MCGVEWIGFFVCLVGLWWGCLLVWFLVWVRDVGSVVWMDWPELKVVS